jgi:uncharacterized membrane protein YkoI
MRRHLALLLLIALVGGTIGAAPVAAGVENDVRDLVMSGEIMPFEAIRSRVMAQVHGDYIGAEFDAGTRTYRFRFLVNGSVINVDVDARTGQRVRKTSNY